MNFVFLGDRVVKVLPGAREIYGRDVQESKMSCPLDAKKKRLGAGKIN